MVAVASQGRGELTVRGKAYSAIPMPRIYKPIKTLEIISQQSLATNPGHMTSLGEGV